jgi:hypothetical protein
MKTTVMLLGLAAVFASGIACAKIFDSLTGSSDSAAIPAATPAAKPACDGLTGQAKIDCEQGASR